MVEEDLGSKGSDVLTRGSGPSLLEHTELMVFAEGFKQRWTAGSLAAGLHSLARFGLGL